MKITANTDSSFLNKDLKQLFLDYPYKDFQHKKQKIDSSLLASFYAKKFLKSNYQYLFKENDIIKAIISISSFKMLSNLCQKKVFFLCNFLAFQEHSKYYQAAIKNFFKDNKHHFDILITKQPVGNTSGINALLSQGFSYICSESIYSFSLKNQVIDRNKFQNIRLASEKDLPILQKIATCNHLYNRYLYDKQFNPSHIKELYEKTIEASFFNDNQKIFIYEENNKIMGFITIILNKNLSTLISEENYGSLDYIAIDKPFQKLGLGFVLNNYGLNYFQENKISIVSVKTMTDNYPAISLLTKNQFYLTSQNLILHYHK